MKLLRYCLGAPGVVQRFGLELDQFIIDRKPGSAAMWDEIATKSWFFDHCMAVHIQSSALSGFLCAIVENMVSGKSNDSTTAEQAEAVRLLAGGHRQLHSEDIDWSTLNRGLRWILPKAHNAIRRREHTKSQLVELAHRFKQAFHYLGEQMASEGI